MARASAVTIGEGRESVRVEYVKTRAVLRLRSAHARAGLTDAVEVPLADLSRAFGIGLPTRDTHSRFLLFGGSTPAPAGGSGDLLGSYESEDEARAGFHALRQSATARSGWAELVVIGAPGGPRRLCWFGHPGGSRRAGPITEHAGRGRWIRRRRSGPEPSGGG